MLRCQKIQDFFCNCGEPIDYGDIWCLECEAHYEGKYDPVSEYAIRGYEGERVVLQDSKGETIKVAMDEFRELERKDLVWYSTKGAIDYK